MDGIKEKLVKLVEEDSCNNGEEKLIKKHEEEGDDVDSLDREPEKDQFSKLTDFIISSEERFLFFFDNVDSLDERRFILFIEELLEQCPNVKVLLTGRKEGQVASRAELKMEVKGLV